MMKLLQAFVLFLLFYGSGNIARAQTDSLTRFIQRGPGMSLTSPCNMIYDVRAGCYIIPYDLYYSGKTIYAGNCRDSIRYNPSYSIEWQEQQVDATLSLVIGPTQICLQSSHDNPNPNYIYWLDSLKPGQYEAVGKYLQSTQNDYHVYDCKPWGIRYAMKSDMHDNSEEGMKQFAENTTYALISGANNFLPRENRIPLPASDVFFARKVHICNDYGFCGHPETFREPISSVALPFAPQCDMVCDSSISMYLMPFNALDTVHTVIYNCSNTPGLPVKSCVQVSWFELFIDGGMRIHITPKQMYIASGHDNPNPSYLYWIDTLTVVQYAAIERWLSRHKRYYEVYKHDDYTDYHLEHVQKQPLRDWNSDLVRQYKAEMEAFTAKALTDIINGSNKYLSDKDRIRMPSAGELFSHSVHLCSDRLCGHMINTIIIKD